MNPEVYIYRYVTEGTFDSYLYQTLENKQRFISQIMTSKSPVRSCEDFDEAALSYAEIKALCAGNPAIKEKMDLDIQVSRLRLLKSEHQSQKHRLEDSLLKYYPENIVLYEKRIEGLQHDMRIWKTSVLNHDDNFKMELMGKVYHSKEDAGNALIEICTKLDNPQNESIGKYGDLNLYLTFNLHSKQFEVTMKGALSYTTSLGTSPHGNLIRMDNCLQDIESDLRSSVEQLHNLKTQMENAKLEIQKPFHQQSELTQKSARLAQLNVELEMEMAENERPLDTQQELNNSQDELSPTLPIFDDPISP